jgi:tetratricopeptide (TPR) repeat protein
MSQLRTLVVAAFETAKRGYYRDALDEFRLILSHNPKHPDALYGAAACAYRLERYGEADGFVDDLLRLSPGDKRALTLKKQIVAGEFSETLERDPDAPLLDDEPVEDPFGVGGGNREHQVIEEWQSLDVRIPTTSDLIEEGKIDEVGRLRIFAAYRSAWQIYRREFRSLVVAGWIALFAKTAVLTFFLSAIAGVTAYYRYFPRTILVFCILLSLVAFFIFYPLLGMHTYFCYRTKREGKVALGEGKLFFEKYPYILFSVQWLLAPLFLIPFLVWVAYQFRLTDLLEGVTGPIPFGDLMKGSLLVGCAVQVYFLIRCWFLNVVLIDENLRPVTAVSRAFYLTRGQLLKTAAFVFLQLLLTPLALLPLGIGYPFLTLAQVEAFDQLNSPLADSGKDPQE